MKSIPLKIKTNYSLLNSLIDIEKLVYFAKENNINTLGICDDNLYGAMDFYTICKKNNIKPVIGLDINVESTNILLYAKNYVGYKNLCYISSNEKTYELLKENSNDLICILPYLSIDKYEVLSKIFNDIFISYSNIEERKKITNKKCIYLNDIRCLKSDEIEYIKYAYMIKKGQKISAESEYDFKTNYLLYEDVLNEDLINYENIIKLINIKIEKEKDLLPKFSNETNFDEIEYLKKLCEKGLLKRRNGKVEKTYADRLFYELNIINKMGFSNYFLVVWDYVKFAKKNNILVGPGRGSAASSLVSYSLGITDVDPIKYNLLFERFLNPERVSMPDIDIDFDSTKIEEVINYVREKYGKDNVARIITFGTLKSKLVLRDVSRIFDVDCDEFIKLFDSNLSLLENKKNENINSLLKKDTLLSRIFNISLHLEGLKRHTSINAAGVVISNKQLNHYIPVYDQSGIKVTGFTINHLENLGFLKMDFLALDNLVLLDKLKNEININLNEIDLNDSKTFEIFNKVQTDGIFQFDTSGMKKILKKFNVTSFDDLVALIALFRPGPIDNIDSYIKRKEGKEKINYIHEDLKPILENTYGIIIYQEQIMQIARVISSFSLGEADILRRAMSKKKKEIMDEMKIKFINNAIKNGYEENIANDIFNLIYKFANYGFNKAHSVAYAIISYRLAYLKSHYLSHFMTHLLTMESSNVNKIKEYVLELKNNNIDILKPDINKSSKNFILENNQIRYSLLSIKNISSIIVNNIIEEREKGNFSDFFDFVSRCYKFIDNKTITNLIYAGCFDYLNFNQKTLIYNIDSAFNYASLVSDLDVSLVEKPEIKIVPNFSKEELIEIEFSVFGYYLSYHPVQEKRKNNITTNDIKNYFNKTINLYLLVDRKREVITKNGDRMCFFTGTDEFNEIDLVIFPKLYEKNYNINKGDVIYITGNVEKRYTEYQIIVNKIEKC